ncbi:related to oxidoreductase, short-chain dehydrogenase/reductase [Sporisorium reilianum f. sp. reilianum]|uniref:Related to oxidoreductase, short-chain dehydrogenase/reductase n=1 Tax=Sporisorium reilianum f. sp. reilianum TaxID=72559 RepID=A0A2N8UNY4_9BASI|nr:related to oxidoreductase, short-chain dehydrogenase/reductase [Sporisorium reilianum f. sp. reilianum]
MSTSTDVGGVAGGRLAGKICIVTGGTRGFGAAIVALFVAHGARVLVLDLLASDGPLPSCAESAYALKSDITSRTDWERALAKCISLYGAPPTVVVNNAGWTYSNKPTLDVTDDEFDRVFAVNVKSVYLSVDVLLPELLRRGVGDASWVNVGSTAALRPRPGLVWYNASKGAVSTATKALAVEYAPHKIRFNTVCPVAGNTPLLSKFAGSKEAGDAMSATQLAQFNASIPIGRLSEGSDIANACLFLADEASCFITGIDLPVDGGRCV